jgi:hypothetical protein
VLLCYKGLRGLCGGAVGSAGFFEAVARLERVMDSGLNMYVNLGLKDLQLKAL